MNSISGGLWKKKTLCCVVLWCVVFCCVVLCCAEKPLKLYAKLCVHIKLWPAPQWDLRLGLTNKSSVFFVRELLSSLLTRSAYDQIWFGILINAFKMTIKVKHPNDASNTCTSNTSTGSHLIWISYVFPFSKTEC